MRDILEPHLSQIHENIYMSQELAIIHGDPRAFRLVLRQQPPFAINDHRLGIILQGEIRVNVNLVEKEFSKGMLVFVGPGTIINPVRFSEDLQIYGIGLSPDFPMPFAAGQMPPAFNGQVRDFQAPCKGRGYHDSKTDGRHHLASGTPAKLQPADDEQSRRCADVSL